jgi:polysaccharide deacetylase family protein (PEP-CTERM system associated)
MLNILSVDVEEHFHASEVQTGLGPRYWKLLPSRVEKQTLQVLDLFATHGVTGTFFILGWVADHHPRLIREIATAGHEIACHGYAHRLVYDLTPEQFREDTVKAMQAIEDACGISPKGYRAPSYSITRRSMWALDVLAELGFTHDSSIYPIQHDRYGIPGFGRHAQIIPTSSGPLCEVPIATVQISDKRVAPVGGGGYMRLLPYRYTAAGIRRINEEEHRPACIYFHPWEIDTDLPRIASGWISRVRTYGGLGSMVGKLNRLMSEFRFSTVSQVHPASSVEATVSKSPLKAQAWLSSFAS